MHCIINVVSNLFVQFRIERIVLDYCTRCLIIIIEYLVTNCSFSEESVMSGWCKGHSGRPSTTNHQTLHCLGYRCLPLCSVSLLFIRYSSHSEAAPTYLSLFPRLNPSQELESNAKWHINLFSEGCTNHAIFLSHYAPYRMCFTRYVFCHF